MIKNNIRRLLEIIFFIIKKNHTSLKEISNELTILKRTVKEDITTLNALFDEHFGIANFVMSNRLGTITINPEYKQNAVKYSYALKLALLKSSVLFNYCVLLTTNSTIHVDSLINQLFISKTYLSKLTLQLNTFLNAYDIRILSDNDYYSLSGNELFIRMFSYLFIQDSFQNLEWPFKEIDIEEIRKAIPEKILTTSHQHSITKKNSLYILYGIIHVRTKNKHFLQLPDLNDLKEVLAIMKEGHDVGTILHKKIFNIAPKYLEDESLFFNFMTRIYIPDIITEKNKIKTGQLFLASNNTYTNLSKEIYTQFTLSSPDSFFENQKYLYIYYLTILTIFYTLIGEKSELLIDLFIPKPTFYLTIDNHYIKSIQEMMSKLVPDTKQAQFISSLIYSLSISDKQFKLKIYLQMTKDFTASYFIKNRLAAIYNSDNVFITNDYSAADIVITDTLEETDNTKEIFYLDSTNHEEGWTNLTNLIQKVSLEKIRLKEID